MIGFFLGGGGGGGGGFVCFTPCSGFLWILGGDNILFYYLQQSTRWRIHGKVIALEKKQLGKSNWLLVQS